jgi:hypothetical protein
MRDTGRTLRRPGKLTAAILAIAAAGSLSACKEVEKAEKVHYQPATLSDIKGDPDHKAVTLTPEGRDRIVLKTALVEDDGQKLSIPYAALLYEPDGHTYVYTNPKGLTYVHTSVEVERVEGNTVLLKHGPKPGTKVVTQGIAQVHGAELEYGEY